ALVLAYVAKFHRLFLAPLFAKAEKQPRVAYRAALDRLTAVGVMRERGEPRERFAKRVQAVSPSFSPLTSPNGGCQPGSDSLRESARKDGAKLAGLSLAVGREVRRGVPWWRWILGAINPVSWLWSR